MEIHDLGKYWKADEVAECLKVDDSTYKELWSCVKLYEDLPRGEAPGAAPRSDDDNRAHGEHRERPRRSGGDAPVVEGQRQVRCCTK